MTISGHEGAGPFAQPRAVVVDRRSDEPDLYGTDRGNARIRVYDLDGAFRRVAGPGELIDLGGFAVIGDHLVRLTSGSGQPVRDTT